EGLGRAAGPGARVRTGGRANDPARFAVAEPDADVERVFVVQEAQLRRLGGGLALVRVTLAEAAVGRRTSPRLFVEPAVHSDRRSRALRLDDGLAVLGGDGNGGDQRGEARPR